MRLKTKEIIEILNSIESLAKEKLPIKLAWKMEKLRKELLPIFEEYTELIELIKKEKALKNADGSFVMTKTELGEFSTQMVFDSRDIIELDSQINLLLEEEKDLNSNFLIKIHEFPGVEVPLECVQGLDKIFVE